MYISKLSTYNQLSVGLTAYLEFILSEHTFSRNQRITLPYGELGHYPLLAKGNVRFFAYDEVQELEVTLFFWYENQIIYHMDGLDTEFPGQLMMQFLDDSVLWSFSNDHLPNIFKLFREFVQIYTAISTEQKGLLLSHIYNLGHLDASSRYKLLMEQHPRLFNLCEVKHIASFLGMDQKTLSRLRSGSR